MARYDCIIIGAGLGGLTAANFLSSIGFKVLLVEKEAEVGGCVRSFEVNGFTFDMPPYMLSELGENGNLSILLRELGVSGLKVKKARPRLKYIFPDREVVLESGPGSIREGIIRAFPQEKRQIELFLQEITNYLERVAQTGVSRPLYEYSFWQLLGLTLRTFITNRRLLQYNKRSVELLNRYFKEEQLKLLFLAPYPFREAAFVTHAYHWNALLRDEVYYLEGGIGQLPQRLLENFERNGGRILLGQEVVKVRVKEGQVTGVVTAAGRSFHCRYLISALNPIYLWEKLVEEGNADYLAGLKRKRLFPSAHVTYLGVGGWERRKIDGCDTLYYIPYEAAANLPGDFCPQDPVLNIRLPSVYDRSITSSSGDIIQVLQYGRSSYWKTSSKAEYRRLEEEFLAATLGVLERKVLGGGLQQSIEVCKTATPLSWEQHTYTAGGSLMGWSPDPQTRTEMVPQHTPLPNLFLAGQWSYPGGGIPSAVASGCYAGHLVAKKEQQP